MVAGHLRSTAAGLFAVLCLAIVSAAPAAAAPPASTALNSTDAMLKWINAYRSKPDPDGLPTVVRALSELQAFKDAETSGAYIGFIAGVLGANPARAEDLIAKMLPIAPADHWVLVRAIAYSRPVELEGAARHLRRSHADAPRHDRQDISTASCPRSIRSPTRPRSPACSTRSNMS